MKKAKIDLKFREMKIQTCTISLRQIQFYNQNSLVLTLTFFYHSSVKLIFYFIKLEISNYIFLTFFTKSSQIFYKNRD